MSHSALRGKEAPKISLPDTNGEIYNLTPGEKGLPIALFFYPQAGSLGCTKEVCQFRDAVAEKDEWGPEKLIVVGISPDSVEKQKKFSDKEKVTYPLLSDDKGEVRKAYNVGKALFGLSPAARVTFIIDGKGVIRDSLDGTINFAAHSKFVGTWLVKLNAEAAGADKVVGAETTTAAVEASEEAAATEA